MLRFLPTVEVDAISGLSRVPFIIFKVVGRRRLNLASYVMILTISNPGFSLLIVVYNSILCLVSISRPSHLLRLSRDSH